MPLHAVRRSSCTGNEYSAARGRGGRASGGNGRASIQSKPGGATAFNRSRQFGRLERFLELEVDDLGKTFDAQPERQSEGDLGSGAVALGEGDGDLRRARSTSPRGIATGHGG